MYSTDNLPTTEQELTMFLMQGRTFMRHDSDTTLQADVEYHRITCHLARNPFLIDQAELLMYNLIHMQITGTGEQLFLYRYDQFDRFLYRKVCQNWNLMEKT